MTYSVQLAPAAERQLKKLPHQIALQIIPVLKALADEPRPFGARKLKGAENIVRKGDYRVLYEVTDEQLTVLVVRIDHRKQVYRNV